MTEQKKNNQVSKEAKIKNQQSKQTTSKKIEPNETRKEKEKKLNQPAQKQTITQKNLKITKDKVIYLLLGIIDIIIIIYAARKNYANFVSLAGSKSTYIGDSTKNLIFGKNYITLLTTAFFFIYICLLNKFMFHKKNTKKFVIILLLLLLIINCTLFYAFTNKIY